MRSLPCLALFGAPSACAPVPAQDVPPPLPRADAATLSDPGRRAVLSAAYVFADPRRVAGRPAEAARAAAELEWMAAALPGDPRWAPANPLLFPALAGARDELRGSLGLAPGTPAAIGGALSGAADALAGGQRAQAAGLLDPVARRGGAAVLARLEALPPLPRAAQATRLAQEEMIRLNQDDPSP